MQPELDIATAPTLAQPHPLWPGYPPPRGSLPSSLPPAVCSHWQPEGPVNPWVRSRSCLCRALSLLLIQAKGLVGPGLSPSPLHLVPCHPSHLSSSHPALAHPSPATWPARCSLHSLDNTHPPDACLAHSLMSFECLPKYHLLARSSGATPSKQSSLLCSVFLHSIYHLLACHQFADGLFIACLSQLECELLFYVMLLPPCIE